MAKKHTFDPMIIKWSAAVTYSSVRTVVGDVYRYGVKHDGDARLFQIVCERDIREKRIRWTARIREYKAVRLTGSTRWECLQISQWINSVVTKKAIDWDNLGKAKCALQAWAWDGIIGFELDQPFFTDSFNRLLVAEIADDLGRMD